MKNIKPSDLLPFDKIPKAERSTIKLHSSVNYVCNDWYLYYKNDGIWMPHRKPTVKEIINNKFSQP